MRLIIGYLAGITLYNQPGRRQGRPGTNIPPNLSRHNERRPHQLRAAHRHTLATLLLIRIGNLKVANSHCAKCFFLAFKECEMAKWWPAYFNTANKIGGLLDSKITLMANI